MRLYGMTGWGNCWKPAVLMDRLGIADEWIETDILRGARRTPQFLARNPNGKVPLLEIRPDQFLAESNAMLCYLAEGSKLLPGEACSIADIALYAYAHVAEEGGDDLAAYSAVRTWMARLERQQRFTAMRAA